jgi:murein DD-endopeptidase MepM/ murein hydrolase activator NlpD
VAAPAGSPILAAHAGTVVYSGFLGGYGNTVIIEHENGYRTLYAHAAKNLVVVGERVAPEQVIGIVGNTGRSTGSHLHFELEKDGEKLDPLGYLIPSKESPGGNSI